MPDEVDPQIRQQRAKFIKAFDDIATATENLAAISKKQVELMNVMIDTCTGLAATVMEPNDGLRDVLDELITEVRGLREDIRTVVKAGGATSVLALLGGAPQRRR